MKRLQIIIGIIGFIFGVWMAFTNTIHNPQDLVEMILKIAFPTLLMMGSIFLIFTGIFLDINSQNVHKANNKGDLE